MRKQWHAHTFRGLMEVSTWLNEQQQQGDVQVEHFSRWGDGEFILIAFTTAPLPLPPLDLKPLHISRRGGL